MKTSFTFDSYSFGCRVNHAEREEIDRELIKSGFSKKSNNPSVYVINTCSITKRAEREARQLIYKIKRNSPNTLIAVTGCSATYWLKNRLYKDLAVDLMVGNTSKQYIVRLIQRRLNMSKCKKRVLRDNNHLLDKFQSSSRSIIKIQDGCHQFCSYCIIPYLRGSPKSESIKNIINRINYYHSESKEIIYTAINTSAFGIDSNQSIEDLIESTVKKTTVSRISFGSIHPLSISKNFLKTYKKKGVQKRFVHFFHIPIQSGSNKMLRLMKRGYKIQDISKSLSAIRNINKFAFFATDVIVGFLDETNYDFKQTYEFLRKSEFSKFHVFRYSKRINTAGYYMAKRLYEPPSHKKKERSLVLRQLSDKKFVEFQKKLIGYTCRGLILNKKKGIYTIALLNNQVPALVKCSRNDVGKIKPLVVVDFDNGSLYSRIA